MKTFIIYTLIMLAPFLGKCQPGAEINDVPVEQTPANISSALYQLSNEANTRSSKSLEQQCIVDAEGRIELQIRRGNNNDLDLLIDKESLSKEIGFEIRQSYKNVASVWVFINEIETLRTKLPAGYFLSLAQKPTVNNEGPQTLNSHTYAGTEVGGEGIKIAIIDAGFQQLDSAAFYGHVPPVESMDLVDFSNSGFTGNTIHGTGCTETVYDHAPNAEYVLIRVGSALSFALAMDYCRENEVDIASISLAYFNLGWDDDTGVVCDAVNTAANEGMIIFNAAGNYFDHHWQGNFNDVDNNGFHEWSANDENNRVTIPDGASIRVVMDWDSDFEAYDLFLVDPATGFNVAFSTGITNSESLSYTNDTGASKQYFIRVSGAGNVNVYPAFQLFTLSADCNCSLSYTVPTSSTATPSNSTNPLVVSVAAAEFADFESESGVIASYSSRGPTNNGNLAIQLTGPTATTSYVYNGPFEGTSCATPNIAGAAAAFWSAHSEYIGSSVVEVMFRKAEIVKDWGDIGTDNTYGHGGVNLYDYHPLNEYVNQASNNEFAAFAIPYLNIWQTDWYAPLGAHCIFLGENYEPSGGGVVQWEMLYKSYGKSTIIR